MSDNLSKLESVNKAIISLKKGKQKLTISKIAKRANIARKTIYNRPELKQLCDQAIYIQSQSLEASQSIDKTVNQKGLSKPKSANKILQERYKKLREDYKMEQEKNQKLLFNNKELVLEKEQLKSRIVFLEEKIDRMNQQKIKKLK